MELTDKIKFKSKNDLKLRNYYLKFTYIDIGIK